MQGNISYHRVSSDNELQQILSLQRINLPGELSLTEKDREGFVTVHHTFEILKKMNDSCAHIVAKDKEKVIGYALCMLEEFKESIEVLKPMFKEIESCVDLDVRYVVMGQICVDKSYRKKGVFRGLYAFMKSELSDTFDMIITEVDVSNVRSSNAHKAIGFNLLKLYQFSDRTWELISMSLK